MTDIDRDPERERVQLMDALVRAAETGRSRRLVCPCCGGEVVLDGPHPAGRNRCTMCGGRTGDLRLLVAQRRSR